MPQQKNSNQGITTIALIVTMIILLVLASVSISKIYGDRGIMTESKGRENELSQEVSNSEEFIKDTEQEYLNAMHVSP